MDTDGTINTSAAERDLDGLMEQMRAEVAERRQAAEANASSEPPNEPDKLAVRRWTAHALLMLPAPEFARAVYLAFLGREPSPDEFVRLRDRLLIEHVGRMRILREFRASPGARTVEGFWLESVKDRLYWSPPAKFGRAFIRVIVNIYHSPRWTREFIARVELLERRSAEAAAAVRALQSGRATDRQNMLKQGKQLQDQLVSTKQGWDAALANRAGALENRISREIHEVSTRLTGVRTDHWRAIRDQNLRVEALLATDRPTVLDVDGTQSLHDREKSHLLDALYLSFEDRYRGTREDIKERQRVYLGRISDCVAATGHGAVIDIGCGRGEWLELLGETGISANGYDLNRIAAEECRERGLDVTLGDAIEALSKLPDESCAAITGFHIIEHLPFEILVKLLDQSLRVLRPGGLLVLETPNPSNLVVAAETFYFDPTHRNPLPSELTSYLLKSRGFSDIEILPLHPCNWPQRQDYTDPMLSYLQDKLFGPQDYAAIARKSP
ncbi:MAG TPA: class I SAM-dependent methyltransferase [Rhizomicrobium sp.]|jgi:SAM-dependent methyltransferase